MLDAFYLWCSATEAVKWMDSVPVSKELAQRLGTVLEKGKMDKPLPKPTREPTPEDVLRTYHELNDRMNKSRKHEEELRNSKTEPKVHELSGGDKRAGKYQYQQVMKSDSRNERKHQHSQSPSQRSRKNNHHKGSKPVYSSFESIDDPSRQNSRHKAPELVDSESCESMDDPSRQNGNSKTPKAVESSESCESMEDSEEIYDLR